MKQRGKVKQMQAELFDELGSSHDLTLLQMLVGQNLELETAIGELLLSAIGKAEALRENKNDA